jgi:hypothetical protein
MTAERLGRVLVTYAIKQSDPRSSRKRRRSSVRCSRPGSAREGESGIIGADWFGFG